MRKFHKRWYEKNCYLSAFMGLIRDLPVQKQCEISIDMILKISDLIERDYNKIIKKISQYNPKDYRRWYDKNPSVHCAIESLRDLDDNKVETVINEFSTKVSSLLGYNSDGEE